MKRDYIIEKATFDQKVNDDMRIVTTDNIFCNKGRWTKFKRCCDLLSNFGDLEVFRKQNRTSLTRHKHLLISDSRSAVGWHGGFRETSGYSRNSSAIESRRLPMKIHEGFWRTLRDLRGEVEDLAGRIDECIGNRRGINRFLHSVQRRATAPPPVSFNEETSRRRMPRRRYTSRSDYSVNCER